MSQFYRPNNAGQQFVHALANAYRDGVRIYDPSLALQNDPLVYETMMREPTIKQAFDRRKTLVAGITWGVETDSDDPRDKAAAKIAEGLLRQIRQFRESRKHLASAIERGTSYVHIEWGKRYLRLGPDRALREWLVPMNLRAIDRREFRAISHRDRLDDARHRVRVEWERWSVAEHRWMTIAPKDRPNYIRHAYDDSPERLGHGNGLIEAVNFFWYFLTNIREELLTGIEFWSRGFVEIAVEQLKDGSVVNQALVDRYVEQVMRHRSRHVFVHDANDEVKLTQGGSEGTNICLQAIEELKGEIRSLINHANLNVSANKGGSYALGDTQADSEQMIVQADRESLSETLTIGLLEPAWFANAAPLSNLSLLDAEPGRFAIVNQKLQDPAATSQVFQTVLASGAPIPRSHYYRELGIPEPQPGEDVIQGQPAAPPGMGGPPGLEGLPG